MSEKRLIDFDTLMCIGLNCEFADDFKEEFDKLPKPTLADIPHDRELKDMEGEIVTMQLNKIHQPFENNIIIGDATINGIKVKNCKIIMEEIKI